MNHPIYLDYNTTTPIAPTLFGAEHHGLRPGTENVFRIVGLGDAARPARTRLPKTAARLAELRDALHRRLRAVAPGRRLNRHPRERRPNTLYASFPGISGRDLLAACTDTLATSVGSVCHAHGDTVSGVLAAMGCDTERARCAVRLSVGYSTTAAEIEATAVALVDAWRGLTGRVLTIPAAALNEENAR